MSGTEHDQIGRFLLGIIINIPLAGGFNAVRLLRATWAILDFIYLAQYPCHTSDTLPLLDDALSCFHSNKSIFVDLGIRTNFNLLKLHSLRHYIEMVQLFGTTNNYTTEYTKQLHIDLAKDAYRATNHKEEYYQMTKWLKRREKVLWHRSFIRWRQEGDTAINVRVPPNMCYARVMKMTSHPSINRVLFEHVETTYRARFFVDALCHFVANLQQPGITGMQLERAAYSVVLPFYAVSVFHKIKFHSIDGLGHKVKDKTVNAIHCHPDQCDIRGKIVPGRYDTALVKVGEGGDVGVEGECATGI